MDEINIIYKLQKRLQATLQQIGDVMISGGVDNMEKYKYLLGQAQAYQLILQEISNLLNDKEQNDEQPDLTNVVHFGDGNTED
jgi:acetyl-CoA acetyltransferase